MKTWKLSVIFQPSNFLSPLYLVQWAMFISAVFVFVQLLGLLEFTSILNGTVGSVALGWDDSIILAVIYLVAYFAFVILVPIFILAAALLTVWNRYLPDKKN